MNLDESVVTQLGDYYDAELPPETMRQIKNYLQKNRDCAAFYEDYKKTIELYCKTLVKKASVEYCQRLTTFLRQELRNKLN